MKGLLGLFLVSLVAVADVKLSEVESSSDGFCTRDVLKMESARRLTQPDKGQKAFEGTALARAKAVYLSSEIGDPDAKPSDLKAVDQKLVLFETTSTGVKELGYRVTVHNDGDEDHVTFYLLADKTKAKLLMALHDNQSAEAHWVCE